MPGPLILTKDPPLTKVATEARASMSSWPGMKMRMSPGPPTDVPGGTASPRPPHSLPHGSASSSQGHRQRDMWWALWNQWPSPWSGARAGQTLGVVHMQMGAWPSLVPSLHPKEETIKPNVSRVQSFASKPKP